MRKGKKTYYKDKLLAAGTDSSRIWAVINELLNRPSKSRSIDSLVVDDEHITDEQTIADKINIHFASIGTKEWRQKVMHKLQMHLPWKLLL